jgi:hypothetical protein
MFYVELTPLNVYLSGRKWEKMGLCGKFKKFWLIGFIYLTF